MTDVPVADRGPAVFDHTEMAGPQFWDALRELQRRGPLVWVESCGGFWAATSNELVVKIAQDWQTFTSSEGVAYPRPGPELMPYLMPIDFDPPRHTAYRKQVNPWLTPKEVSAHEQQIRAIADELIDAFVELGSCDIIKEFARVFPGTVFFRLIVHCGDDDFRSVEPAARAVSFESDQQKRAEGQARMRTWAAKVLDARSKESCPEDIASAVLRIGDSGQPIAEHEYQSGLAILASGGIGTSASVIGAAMRILAEDRDLQQRVRANPALIPALVEETLRIEPPIPLMFRRVRRDVEIAGQQLQQGDWLALFFGAANRDPAVFEHPERVDIDRPHYRHLTFSAGPHRCIGSNLARLQIRIAMEQLLSRLSPFWLPENATFEYVSQQARSLMSMPLEFAGRD
jgi:cytochrome P450